MYWDRLSSFIEQTPIAETGTWSQYHLDLSQESSFSTLKIDQSDDHNKTSYLLKILVEF